MNRSARRTLAAALLLTLLALSFVAAVLLLARTGERVESDDVKSIYACSWTVRGDHGRLTVIGDFPADSWSVSCDNEAVNADLVKNAHGKAAVRLNAAESGQQFGTSATVTLTRSDGAYLLTASVYLDENGNLEILGTGHEDRTGLLASGEGESLIWSVEPDGIGLRVTLLASADAVEGEAHWSVIPSDSGTLLLTGPQSTGDLSCELYLEGTEEGTGFVNLFCEGVDECLVLQVKTDALGSLTLEQAELSDYID